MRLAEASTAERAQPAMAADSVAHQDIQPAELQLRLITTPRELARIERLRRQIPLPAQVVSDPGFAALEKKGTGWESLQLSNGAGARSAR